MRKIMAAYQFLDRSEPIIDDLFNGLLVGRRDLFDVIASIDGCPPIEDLGRFVENLVIEKYDAYVPEDLLRRVWIRRYEPLREPMSQLIRELASIKPD